MAASSAFKIQCPSCEAMVTIRDPALVGKKVACPKCKYRFVVEKPPEPEADAEEGITAQKPRTPSAGEASADGDAKGKKPKKNIAQGLNKRLVIGAGLAGVGLLVLIIAFFAMRGGGPKKPVKPPDIAKGGVEDPDGPDKEKKIDKGDKGVKENDMKQPPPAPVGDRAGPELTNLLPAGSQSVFAFNARNFLDSEFGAAAFMPGAFDNEDLKKRLGFSVQAVDALYRADRFTEPNRWSFVVLHTLEPLDSIGPLMEPLGLKPAPPIDKTDKQEYYEVTRNQRLLLNLPRLSLGVPPAVTLPGAGQGPLFLRRHDAQTLVFGQTAPMTEFLKAKGKLPAQGKQPPPVFGQPPTYTTVNAELRGMLQQLESQAAPAREKVLFYSATEVGPARQAALADSPGRMLWHTRPYWDISHLLPSRLERVRLLGTALSTKDARTFNYLNLFECAMEDDARSLELELKEQATPEFAFLQKELLRHKIELPQEKVEVPKDFKDKKPPPPAVSRIGVEQKGNAVTFALALVLDEPASEQFKKVQHLLLCGLKGELDVADALQRRQLLAAAGKELGEKGLTNPLAPVPPGQYPPGAFPIEAKTRRTSNEPHLRISWMAGLLPYLGQNTLYDNINFGESWKDRSNWLAARTLVPQFIDPSFPATSRYLLYPGMPLDAAATHYVGLAGIGPGAAEYPPGDKRRGVFGYDRGATLKEIQAGHGAANTILLIRVPWDGPAGVTPWMAGGGSNVRTVPEKNSLEPFLSTDREGLERGTYMVMVDSSVRYVKQGMSDAVFKALATVDGPLPGDFDLDKAAPRIGAADKKKTP